ncbi:MAG: flagellar assembly protein H [Microcoleus sp. PH2017_10_PVI_O_A]|uniref:flagellar assembly protein H n=1 Tax=unclassified Microcoleus TaxID=2642155 RepID=UPI001DF5BE12|nr:MULTISPECIES: flagellar assembly protein H [unclassified Microcoleus]TAE79327.1 MAG: flagellar assembly protein H [Oscillatoriales cyanobacterium]MCC3408291.1 flagellar assembly protein H [Microcoleus sp. PH2017_10_PVI_O_A]MCC3462473.1 flagellar assembly protein H [Microcoleus sp. PH2017_11_PCY_U_A]MCC3480842.1 flagellar assembly protein H [Microcoleus sp. PH2017_12_PCY_D_A]MCC3531072.1 flagellar assembly protein H [Microcoleus sp. PH2017_21_RUC_O_A]
MTKFPHDQFAKEYLQELLSPLGQVETSKAVTAEVREIDVWFQPTSSEAEYLQSLGLLGQVAATIAVIEPFRNPVNTEEIFSCVVKLLNSRAQLGRVANREDQRLKERQLPTLWILTPTASELLLDSFGFRAPEESEGWGKGVYFLTEVWRVGLIAIHQLPRGPQTMWLRMLGRGRVQEQAIAELSALPVDNPLRTNALQLLYILQANLQANTPPIPARDDEDQELVMAIAPLFQQHLEAAKQQGQEEGREQGREQGREEGQRMILESFLQVRFGELDPRTVALILPISALAVAEFTLLLVQLSTLPAGQNEHQQVQNLLAQKVLEKSFIQSGQLEELPVNLIPNLLALSPDNLSSLLAELPQLSIEELMARLAQSLT